MLNFVNFTKIFMNIIRMLTADEKILNCRLRITRQKYKKNLILWHDLQKIKKKF